MMNALSLFSGIGGLDLAAEWAGITPIWFCEKDEFCQAILKKHWSSIPITPDIKDMTKKNYDIIVDIVYGGFPCQPFSQAGRKLGMNDERYLWPEFLRVIRDFKPRWVLIENVPGVIPIAGYRIQADLDASGYSVWIWNFEAAAVGAPHRRARVFFVGHAERCGLQGLARRRAGTELEDGCSDVTDSDGERRQEQLWPVTAKTELGGSECGSWWLTEPDVGRVAYGVPNRVDRLRALGNAVVPQQAYPLFKAIKEVDDSWSSQ